MRVVRGVLQARPDGEMQAVRHRMEDLMDEGRYKAGFNPNFRYVLAAAALFWVAVAAWWFWWA